MPYNIFLSNFFCIPFSSPYAFFYLSHRTNARLSCQHIDCETSSAELAPISFLELCLMFNFVQYTGWIKITLAVSNNI